MRHAKQTIIVLSICLACSLAATIYFFVSGSVSYAGEAMEFQGETTASSVNGYGALFVSLGIAYFLFVIIRKSRR